MYASNFTKRDEENQSMYSIRFLLPLLYLEIRSENYHEFEI